MGVLLLPGQPTEAVIEEGPFRLSRNPLYVLLAFYPGPTSLVPTFWGLMLFPVAALLTFWGATRPEERLPQEESGEQYAAYRRRCVAGCEDRQESGGEAHDVPAEAPVLVGGP